MNQHTFSTLNGLFGFFFNFSSLYCSFTCLSSEENIYKYGIRKTRIKLSSKIPVSKRASRQNPRKPWVNAEVTNNCKKKRQSWTKLCHTNANRYASVEDKLKVHQDWIAARNLAIQTTNNARSTYESRVIMDTKNNRMSLWSYVSYVKSMTKKPGDESCLENRDGGLIHDNLSKSKILNEYFSSVFVRKDDDNFYGKILLTKSSQT